VLSGAVSRDSSSTRRKPLFRNTGSRAGARINSRRGIEGRVDVIDERPWSKSGVAHNNLMNSSFPNTGGGVSPHLLSHPAEKGDCPRRKKKFRSNRLSPPHFRPNQSSFTPISPVFKMGDVEMANSAADSKPEKLYELPRLSL
jgi:hypothetical protein